MHTHTYTHTGMEGAINQMPHSVIKFIETAANADNDNGDGAKGSWPVNCQFDCLSACECEWMSECECEYECPCVDVCAN